MYATIPPLPALRDRLTPKRRERARDVKCRPCSTIPATLRLVVVGLTLMAVVVSGCSKPTLSADAYRLVNALDRVFEKRDPQQLMQASEKINEELAAGKITPDEANLLNALIAKAKANNWDTASSDARQLLADQTDW